MGHARAKGTGGRRWGGMNGWDESEREAEAEEKWRGDLSNTAGEKGWKSWRETRRVLLLTITYPLGSS